MGGSYQVQFTDRHQSWSSWTWGLPRQILETIRNTVNAISCQGLLSLFQPCYWSGRDVSVCHFPGQTQYMITNGHLIQKVLESYTGPGDRYHCKPSDEVWMPILTELLGEELTADDFLLICADPNKIEFYRKMLRLTMNEENRREIIQSCVKQCPKLEGQVNMSSYIGSYTTLVIAQLIGYSVDWEACDKIREAIDVINRFSMRKQLQKPQSDKEKNAFSQALNKVKEAIDQALVNRVKGSNSLVDRLMEENCTERQVKGMVFLAFFAGSETSALLLSSLVWHLGSNHEWQEDLFLHPEQFSKYMHEALRYCPPVPFIGRHPNKNMELQAGQDTYIVSKGDDLLTAPFFAARDPNLFLNPNQYDPNRENTGAMSWCPFSSGKRMCSGKQFALDESEAFINFLVSNYEFSTVENEHPPMEGYLTMKLERDVKLTVKEKIKVREEISE